MRTTEQLRDIATAAARQPAGNERGSALIITVLVLLLLTIIGLSATTGTDTELLIAGNEKQATQTFYNANAGAADAMEVPTSWLTSAYLVSVNNNLQNLQDATTKDDTLKYLANATNSYTAYDQSSNQVATVTVRPVYKVSVPTNSTNIDAAKQDTIPTQTYKTPPPVGSGYGLGKFAVQHYAITSTATTSSGNKVQVQVGVWKAFNK